MNANSINVGTSPTLSEESCAGTNGIASLLSALECMPDGFCTTDPEWTVTYMNHKAAIMLGQAGKEGCVGKNLWACFPQAVGTRFYTEYQRAAAENTAVLIQEYYPPLNTWFEVHVYPHAGGLSFYFRDISARKQQERALQLSHERFQLVGQATHDAVWDWNLQEQYVQWGEGFQRLFGYTFSEDKIDVNWVSGLIHPDDRERVAESIRKALESTESNWATEFRFRKADNTYAYVSDKGFIIRDAQQVAVRMVGVGQDVTSHKMQEKRLEFIAKATSELIWERAIDGEEVYLNTARLRELTGYELPGPTMPVSFWLDRIHPDDRAQIEENRRNAVLHEWEFYVDEHRFRRADGQWAYMKNRIYVIRDLEGSRVSLIGATEDVTPQRLYEKALIESEESYRELFDHAPLPTIIFDAASLVILEANQATQEQYGYSRQELTGMNVLDVHFKEEHARVRQECHNARPSTRNTAGMFHHIKKNGERLLVEVTATPIQYKGRAALLATANDLTEKVRLQKQLIEEKISHQKSMTKVAIEAQEKQRNEIGRELHDNVNQMLAAAKLYMENIRYLKEQQDHFIDRSVELLSRSINEIRWLSHALVTPAIKETGLKGSLLALAETFRELRSFEIYTVFEFDEQQLASGLELTLYRIIQECFSNTVKYAKASEVTILISVHRRKLQVMYSDNGTCFVPSAVKKGIGLKNIIHRAEAYRGKVKISATQQGGFELNVAFPLGAG